jgi:hypothetical protein
MAVSRGMRRPWVGAGAVIALASLGWGTFQVTSALAFDRQKFRESFAATESAAVRTIDVDNSAGSVDIVGSDRGDIAINGAVIRGIESPKHSERIAGDTLEIDASCHSISSFCSVDYDIQVPRDVAVRIRASGGGVRVANVTGRQDIGASGGGVRVEGAEGALHLRSSGGGITAVALHSADADVDSSGGGVRLEFIDAPQTVRATSSGGGVTVVIPDTDISYNVDASSSGGGVSRDVRSDPASSRTISVHSSGGGVTVQYPNSP